MKKAYCSVDERQTGPLFEVFDGGDLVLSSYHDIESDKTEMSVYVACDDQAPAAVAALEAALGIVGVAAPVSVADVPDEDWKYAYRRHFKTEKIGRRLMTVPVWELEGLENPERRELLVLDPGMAFGTGKHETTRACLEYIEEVINEREGERGAGKETLSFLDMGCGSGILSIAAAKLGYAPVAGFDIDDEAVQASRENAALNGVSVEYRTFALGKGAVTLDASIEAAKGVYPDLALQGRANDPAAPVFAPADLVVANILGPLLIAFADEIVTYAKQHLVVSGILSELYSEVLAAFVARGYREISRRTLGEWTTGRLIRAEM